MTPILSVRLAIAAVVLSSFVAIASASAQETGAASKGESVEASICRLIETAARAHSLPVAFLTRLIWRESSFRASVTSPAGARGIAQFMPGTADERGLANPFDPEEAIPKAAELLAELDLRFGNLGLAAAAYNAGPTRLANWLAGQGYLPVETRDYVLAITRHPVEDWIGEAAAKTRADAAMTTPASCTQAVATFRSAGSGVIAAASPIAPWGVQLAGSFSKAAALAAYARTRASYPAALALIEPMILGGRVRSRGFAPFYRVRAPAPTRAAAEAICKKIQRAGGICVVLRS